MWPFFCMLKRVRWARDLHIRTLVAMVKVGPLRLRPLMLRFLTGPAHALVETRSLAQESACKDLDRNGLGPGHHVQGHLHSDS